MNDQVLPKHHNPDQQDVAHAPYNFIPLPDVVVKAVESANDLPDHDCYLNDRHTGYFEVTLTTKTPLYIRGMLSTHKKDKKTPSEYEQAEAEKAGNAPKNFRQAMKNKPEFFTTHNPEQPVIPGSSLRGMLRSLIEIITYSKVKWVTDKSLFFRTMDDSVVGESYRKRMMENVEAGFLRRHGTTYTIHTTSYVRVHHDKLGGASALFDGYVPNQTPKWSGQYSQHKPTWVTLKPSKKFVDQLSLTKQSGPGWYEGRLVITGNMPGRKDGSGGKKKEFVFLLPPDHGQEINVPEAMMDRFHDDDQITQWQQKAFPKNQPQEKSRLRNGLLITKPSQFDEPVFFLREKGELVFIGRAQMFRLPYQQRPLDLIPSKLRDPNTIDFAEAMFGFIRTREELAELKKRGVEPKPGSKAYAGRIFVSDGQYKPDQGSAWMSDAQNGIIEPHILASPKPTSFQLYLTQQTPNDRKTLHHYDSNIDIGQKVTTLRGFKIYWAQGKKTAADLQAKPKDDQDQQRAFETINGRLQLKSNSTQHTRMKPVVSGKKFTFQIHFENLTDVELGALQWALTVPNCHRLGMGKPLGMGVVQLEEVKLQLNDRSNRYKTLFTNNTTWNVGKPKDKQDFTADFETDLLKKLGQQNVPFQQIDRIKMLLTMLTWQESPPTINLKRYMDLNQFRNRPVLPDPLNINGTNSGISAVRDRHTVESKRGQSYSSPQSKPTSSSRQPQKPTTQPAQPILREKTAKPVQFVSQLQSGDSVQGRVTFVDKETVFLEFPKLQNLSDKDVLGRISAGHFGKNLPKEGANITCKVISITENEIEFTITCKLA